MARPARIHILAVAILAAGAAAQAAFEAALAYDEHCQAGGGAPCALSARQLRGEAVSGEGRHSSKLKLQGFKEVLHGSLALRRSVKKRLDLLERSVNETYRMVVPEGAIVDAPSRHAGRKDQQAGLHYKQRRRHGGLVPRAAAVQDCYDRLQHILDAEWRRQARCSRLDHWTRTRLEDPSTPPFKQMQLEPKAGGAAEARPEELAEARAVGEGGAGETPKESRARGGSSGLEIELELEIEVEGKVEIDLELELELELRLCSDEEEGEEEDGQAASSEALQRPEIHAAGGKATEAHMNDELDEEFRELAAVVEATVKHAAETRRLVAQTLNVTATA